jgi:hypothetical protein
MRHTIALFGAALLGVGTWGSTAEAQGDNTAPSQGTASQASYYNPPPPPSQKEERFIYQGLAAPVNAFELKLNSGYTQGFGHAAPGLGMPSVAGAGVNGTLDLDYRVNPWWSVGLQGEYQQFVSEDNSEARGLVANIGVTFHGAPLYRGDPYLRFGAGWRQLWSVNPTNPPAPTASFFGFELANLKLGYDFRITPGFAIAPQIGADLTLFSWVFQGGNTSALSSSQVATFIYAGAQVRFDMGGSTTDSTVVAAR